MSSEGFIGPEYVTQLCLSPSATTLALTSHGRIFERMRDTRDFNSGPRHVEKWLWREIDGPLTPEAPS